MAKRRPVKGDPFDPETRVRLLAIGPHETVTDPGYCEIHFDRLALLKSDLAEFESSWFVSGPGKGVPAPGDGLFALWERYLPAHQRVCDECRRRLFAIFSQSAAAGYDDRQWRQLCRSRPTEDNIRSVVSQATLSFHQAQAKAGQPYEYDMQIQFVVFWDSHGVAMRLSESSGEFVLGEWSHIGDL
ncbi:hypothetical protein [Zavarzinella formosa]|uniref:hypothetical protein n=1 Tax=Zavarzinella formosa TaxID=360055 RepID=UPI0003099F92|nr:hypothetical protein [Zavarzinella formosa]